MVWGEYVLLFNDLVDTERAPPRAPLSVRPRSRLPIAWRSALTALLQRKLTHGQSRRDPRPTSA